MGQAYRASSVGSWPFTPELGLTSTSMSSPSTISGASASWAVRPGTSSCSGHQCRVARPTPVPMASPTPTSEGQWTPVWTREYATARARGATASPARGDSMATAVAKAAAEAECPEGNDEDVGRFRRRRCAGTSSSAGRRRGNSGFPMRLAAALAPAIATTPRSAPRRVAPLRVASRAATPHHRRDLFADRESAISASSAFVAGSAALRRIRARSVRPTRRKAWMSWCVKESPSPKSSRALLQSCLIRGVFTVCGALGACRRPNGAP